MSKWTLFWDMHSGGGLKEAPYSKIYIEAPEEQAKVIFYNRFGHNPERVTCTCCGDDYSISQSDSLEAASGYHRGCAWADGDYTDEPARGKEDRYQTVEQYIKLRDVLVVREADIKPEERTGEVPEQGYIWKD